MRLYFLCEFELEEQPGVIECHWHCPDDHKGIKIDLLPENRQILAKACKYVLFAVKAGALLAKFFGVDAVGAVDFVSEHVDAAIEMTDKILDLPLGIYIVVHLIFASL